MRRLLLCCLLLLGSESPAQAFDTGHHQDMTIAALRKEAFSDDAIRVIVLQNWLVDWYSGHADPQWFLSLARTAGSEVSFVPELFRDHDDFVVAFETGYLHFDNLDNGKPKFHEVTGVREYWTTLADTTASELHRRLLVKDPDVLAILSLLGISLHAVQDFYSHSNWVGSPADKDDNSDYDVTTWWDLASASPAPGRVTNAFTGSYGKNARGITHDELNKDNYGRNRWDRAYAAAYWATIQWIRGFKAVVEHEHPGFWAQCLKGAQVRGGDASVLDANLTSSYEISEYLGKWKGGPSSQSQGFTSFNAFRKQSSIFTAAFDRQYVYGPLSRDLGHTDIRGNGLPDGVSNPTFPTIPPDEDAILLVVPEVKSLNTPTYFDNKMFAKIRLTTGNLTQEFVENTEFGNSGNKPLQWKVLFFVPKNTDQIGVQISLFNEGERSHDQDSRISIGAANGRYELSYQYQPSQDRCFVDANPTPCSRSSQLATQGSGGHKAALKVYMEKRHLVQRP